MRSTVLLTTLLLFVHLRVSTAESTHLLLYKGANEVYAECRKYLGYRTPRSLQQFPDHCENYCIGVLARIWNTEEDTVDPASPMRFVSFDIPPQEFLAEVKQCFDRVRTTIPLSDKCRRADEQLLCYSRNGTILLDQPFFYPKTPLQYRRTAVDCANILQISADELGEILRQGLAKHPRGQCLVRCFLIREQLYSEQIGVDPFRVLIQTEEYENYRDQREQALICVGELQRQFLDRCTLAVRIASECFGRQLIDLLEDSVRPLVGLSCRQ